MAFSRMAAKAKPAPAPASAEERLHSDGQACPVPTAPLNLGGNKGNREEWGGDFGKY